MVHTGIGWTDIGSGMLRGDAAWSAIFVFLSLPLSISFARSLHSLARFHLSFFISRRLIPFRAAVLRSLLTTSHVVVALALSYLFMNARIHSLFPSICLLLSLYRLGGSLTRGLRVSRRALWWLLRWLLASLESSQESVPPEGQGTPSGTGSPPSLPLFTSLLLPSRSLFLPPFLPSHLAAVQPALCPLRCSYLRVLLIFSYYRRWACRHVSLTQPRVQPVRTRGTVHLEVYRTLSLPRASSPPSAVPYAPLPHRTASLGAPQVLQYVSTLLRRRKGAAGERRDSGRESREGAKTR